VVSQSPTRRARSFSQRCDTSRATRTRAKLADIAVLLPARRHRSSFRYLLLCESNGIERRKGCLYGLEHPFRGRRLPQAIRSANGVPFASPTAVHFSKLSVLWRRLGISIEPIKPGHPQQNGRRERRKPHSLPMPISYGSRPSSTMSSKSTSLAVQDGGRLRKPNARIWRSAF
jgi:hypothetical protein